MFAQLSPPSQFHPHIPVLRIPQHLVTEAGCQPPYIIGRVTVPLPGGAAFNNFRFSTTALAGWVDVLTPQYIHKPLYYCFTHIVFFRVSWITANMIGSSASQMSVNTVVRAYCFSCMLRSILVTREYCPIFVNLSVRQACWDYCRYTSSLKNLSRGLSRVLSMTNENRCIFWPLIVKKGGLKPPFRKKNTQNIKILIFNDFLKIVKNTLAFMESFYQIIFSYNFQHFR